MDIVVNMNANMTGHGTRRLLDESDVLNAIKVQFGATLDQKVQQQEQLAQYNVGIININSIRGNGENEISWCFGNRSLFGDYVYITSVAYNLFAFLSVSTFFFNAPQ